MKPDWDDLRVFLAVVHGETLSAAGRTLKCDPATVGRRIARLEEALGARLFVKSPQGYSLTESGARLVSHAEAVEQSVAKGLGELAEQGEMLSGQVRIGATDGCATYILPQVCAKIMRAHPNLELQIVALPRVINLSKREADLAITVSASQAGPVQVEKICDYHLHLAASREYLANAPKLDTPDDLQKHPHIGYIQDMVFYEELDFLRELGIDRVALASNLVAVQLGFLRERGGVGLTHDFVLPSTPDIVPVLMDQISFRRSFYLLSHVADARVDRLQQVASQLRHGIAAEIQRLEAKT